MRILCIHEMFVNPPRLQLRLRSLRRVCNGPYCSALVCQMFILKLNYATRKHTSAPLCVLFFRCLFAVLIGALLPPSEFWLHLAFSAFADSLQAHS